MKVFEGIELILKKSYLLQTALITWVKLNGARMYSRRTKLLWHRPTDSKIFYV